MALFKRFGFKKPVEREGIEIAGLASRTEPRITLPKFSGIVEELRGRRILQGEATLYITPKLFHIWLFLLGGFHRSCNCLARIRPRTTWGVGPGGRIPM